MYENEGAACAQQADRSIGAVTAKQEINIQRFLQENDRLIKQAHESLGELETKLAPVCSRQETNAAIGKDAGSSPARSDIAGQVRDQNEYLSNLITRLNELRYKVDL